MVKIMMEFEWHHVSIIVDETEFANKLIRTSLEKEMKIATSTNGKEYPMYIDVQSFSFRNYEGQIVEKKIDFEKLLDAASRSARGNALSLSLSLILSHSLFLSHLKSEKFLHK